MMILTPCNTPILLLQVGYAAVFFWEYFGPMVVYALIYFFPHLIYPWAK